VGKWKSDLEFVMEQNLDLVNPKDLIPDKYLGVGLIDDAAVTAARIALTKDDLATYDVWRKAKAASKKSESASTEPAETRRPAKKCRSLRRRLSRLS